MKFHAVVLAAVATATTTASNANETVASPAAIEHELASESEQRQRLLYTQGTDTNSNPDSTPSRPGVRILEHKSMSYGGKGGKSSGAGGKGGKSGGSGNGKGGKAKAGKYAAKSSYSYSMSYPTAEPTTIRSEAPSLSPLIWDQLGQDVVGSVPANSYSGQAVSLSSDGNIVAIKIPGNVGSINSGKVRVYEYTASLGWVQRGPDIDGENASDNSNSSVSLSCNGNIVAIGAPRNDVIGIGSDPGQVRVYEYDATAPSGWVQRGQDIYGENAGDESGWAVSLSCDGNIVAIGAPGTDVIGIGSDSGQVRVYEYDATAPSGWVQRGQDIYGENAGDESGWAVSLSSDGKTVAIGAPGNDGNGNDSGQVRVYDYSMSSGWVQRGQDIDGESTGDEFNGAQSGSSVSLSSDGNIVAIGAPTIYGYGQVRVYEYHSMSSGWVQRGQDIDGENTDAGDDRLGFSVSLSSDGKRVAIGAPSNDGKGNNSGKARVYEYTASSGWVQRGQDIDGEAFMNFAGYSVSLSSDGTRVAIGFPFNSFRRGQVRVYELN